MRLATMRLEGKVALVTGAAVGIGAAVARRFAAEGASVALTDVRVEEGAALSEALNADGRRTCFVPLDVASESQWTEAVARVIETLGAPTVLVNNAGIYARRLIEETSMSDLDRMLEVNVKGVFLGTKAVLGAMRAAGGGSIVNLSSVAGIIGSAYSSDYNASKGAVRILTKCTAVQYAKDGIRCNSVHPAPIDTDMGWEALPAGEIHDQRLREIPLGRMGTADEVANAILFLASDESSYVTGSELVVDGGFTAR